jgi:hypothetical protein
LPTILTNDTALLIVQSCLWFPQFIKNLKFSANERQFKLSTKFLVSNTLMWVYLAFEARSGGPLFMKDSSYSIFSLRPHPKTI